MTGGCQPTSLVLDEYAVRLGGCHVLLGSPVACRDVMYALQGAVAGARRDGYVVPERVLRLIGQLRAELAEHTDQAASSVTAAGGSAELPYGPDLSASYVTPDPVSVREAAEVLSVGERQVRNLADHLQGRRVGGHWVFDRQVITDEAQRRARRQPREDTT